MEVERNIMQLILHGGNARSKCLEAVETGRKGDVGKAEQLMKEANDELKIAHESQTELIQSEIKGDSIEKSLLMIHAQDHVMNAMTVRDLTKEMIAMIKTSRVSS